MNAARPLLGLVLAALAVGCEAPPSGARLVDGEPPRPVGDRRAIEDPGSAVASTAPGRGVAPTAPSGDAPAPTSGDAIAPVARREAAADRAERRRHFVWAVETLSEPDAAFFSDNLVSNETSFLHVADDLPALAPRGAAYVGVGPEQNFSYLALLEPSVAYVVDIRRDNLRLHLLYKAAFELARSRAAFVALVLGRPAPDGGEVTSDGVGAVLARATAAPGTEASFAEAHDALAARIESWGLRLDRADGPRIEAIHRRFFVEGLELRFSLKEANGRRYPTLRQMLQAEDLGGRERSFLATAAGYEAVARMQREDRVIPVVGDFAGERALPGLARALRARGTPLGTFYVSNVEQYLLEPAVWQRWRRNVAALPRRDGALFVRAWLDQGRRHPRQIEGHRTATVIASIDGFEAAQREARHASWWAVATDALVDPPRPGGD
jgi:hypothetical protein